VLGNALFNSSDKPKFNAALILTILRKPSVIKGYFYKWGIILLAISFIDITN
jgi:hypothetical protein